MQVKQLILAVAATLAAGSVLAAPVTPADIGAARAAGTLQETWISGASAPTFNIYTGFASGCDADSVSLFSSSSSDTNVRPGSLGNYAAYACTRGGVVSVVYHSVADGSWNAYAPHIDGTQLQRLRRLDQANCQVATGAFPGHVNYKSCALVNPAVNADGAVAKPAGGFSDVEASLFGFDVSAAGTEAEAYVGQTFGVAVSLPLYRALQQAQGLNVGSDDPADAPNISSAQYASIIARNAGYQADWSPILGDAGAGQTVYLERRVSTSGTQASSNAHFLKNPCSAGALASLEPAGAEDSTGTFVVTEHSGSGNVKSTLTSRGSRGEFAIGVLSMENNWRTDSASNQGYRYVKLDGVHPEGGTFDGNGNGIADGVEFARETAINGDYPFHIELRSFVANTADAFGAQLIPEITAALGSPANCADVPRGLTLNPLGGSACGSAQVEGELQVTAKGTRFGNNCAAQQLFF
ncbi:hypothetical protein [Methylobacillus flagellatus]|uniref:PBP domain-containing protein n=1 Tax=Methylobacillus flagellatus (strain ATCC 51484 / DSM 6875 / VKM B-1610 / KT) TaxID=265072 RepID=Q1GYL5_METFK|nr:hypothetical protein [Methylobacillus flagellatus]ABE50672.1 hypothetical protein Mfla_2407 [Methylobacillus flagellatus KT]